MASKPNFILLDEPLAGIDPMAIQDIKKLIKKLKGKNIGVLITDHNVKSTLEIVDRAYIIFEGKVLFEGKPDEIVNNKKRKSFLFRTKFLVMENTISVSGKQTKIGSSLEQHAKKTLILTLKKYFKNFISSEILFSKDTFKF